MFTQEMYLKKFVEGLPKPENFGIRQTQVFEPSTEGEVQIEMRAMSVDASVPNSWKRHNPLTYLPQMQEGNTLYCLGAGEIVKSNSSWFKPGDKVTGVFPVQEKFNVNIKKTPLTLMQYPPEVVLSLLGSAGVTAYIGIAIGKAKNIAEQNKNPTALVTTAGGGVGLYAVQILKEYGYTVIGTTSEQKVKQVATYCDHVINRNQLHCQEDYERSLNQFDHIDFMFDNAGGEVLQAALAKMSIQRDPSTIICCGSITQYNKLDGQNTIDEFELIQKNQKRQFGNTTVEGFVYTNKKHSQHFESAPAFLAHLYDTGKIKVENYIFRGFECFAEAYDALYTGRNIGKIIVML